MAFQDPPIKQSYQKLKSEGDGKDAGYAASDKYPSGFQAVDFPKLAGSGSVTMLATDQAFFFLRKPEGDKSPDKFVQDTSKLKELIGNIADNNTKVTMLVDADLILNKERFVEKYSSLQQTPENKEQYRKAFDKEQQIIAGFIQDGGVKNLAKEVLAEKTGATGEELEKKTNDFLQNNFKIKGVMTQQALQAATWQIDAPDGKLMGKQIYTFDVPQGESRWQIGTMPELSKLGEAGHTGAKAITDAVDNTNALKKLDFALDGSLKSGEVVPSTTKERGKEVGR